MIDEGHKFNEDSLIDIMIEYQELIERPIVINGEKAVIGKPPKRIFDIYTSIKSLQNKSEAFLFNIPLTNHT